MPETVHKNKEGNMTGTREQGNPHDRETKENTFLRKLSSVRILLTVSSISSAESLRVLKYKRDKLPCM
jgi:hypothetical protein